MLDQRRPQMQPFERRVDVGDVLRCDDDVVGRDLGGEIADRVLERQVIGNAIHVDAERASCSWVWSGMPSLRKQATTSMR